MPSSAIENHSQIRNEAAWRDAVCNTFVRLECTPQRDAPFHGHLNSGVLGELHVTRVQSSPQVVRRTSELAAQATEAYVLLSIQTRGRTLVQQGGSEALLTPGCIAFYDTARPYTLTLPNDFDQIVLHLPRQTIEANAPGGLAKMATMLPSSNPFAQAILALAPQLLRIATSSPSALAERTAKAAIELISLALTSLTIPVGHLENELPRVTAPNNASAEALIWRTRDLITKQIDDSELTPLKLAAQLNVSIRRLQEVFKAQGTTLSDCIWEARLEFARSLLVSAPHRGESISTIAYRAGFADCAHFSRRFKQRFHVSPSEYRLQG
jgi:AraC-like DNA-binding protein